MLERVVRAVEPESFAAAFPGSAMNAERRPDRVAKLAGADFILTWEYFNPFRQADPLDRQTEPQSGVVDVNAAVAGERRLLEEDPEMSAAIGFLERGLDAVLLEF